MPNKVLSRLAVVLLLVGLAMAGLQLWHSRSGRAQDSDEFEEPPVAAGDVAADFSLPTLDGQVVSLKSLRGKVVFLNVWATWCGPCRDEMPSMETLYEEFKSQSDFVILAISQDQKGRDAVAPYVAKNGYHFPILLDPDNQISDTYNVSGVPETFIIDRKGRIVAHHMGAFDWSRDDVHQALKELLETKQG